MSCSGATTHDITPPSGKLPAQVDAMMATTEIVTVLSGSSEVGIISPLLARPARTGPPLRGVVGEQELEPIRLRRGAALGMMRAEHPSTRKAPP